MTTNIESLPLLKITQGVGIDEDWILSIAFTAGGSALSLSGITFEAILASLPYGVDTMDTVSGVVSGNIVTFTVLASAKASWQDGPYYLSILATDGTNTKDVLSYSSYLTVGNPSPAVVTTIAASGYSTLTAAAAVSAQVAANTAAIAALQAEVSLLQAAVAALQAGGESSSSPLSTIIDGGGLTGIITPGEL